MARHKDGKPATDAAERALRSVLRTPGGRTDGSRDDMDEQAGSMLRLWNDAGDLRHSDNYANLLGTPTWRERLVALRASLATKAPRFALPALSTAALAALAAYLLIPRATHYQAGAQAQALTLPDRSAIVLAPSSALDFRRQDGKRIAHLDGEAQFSVAHDTAHPFLIEVGDALVRVVGTRFTLSYRKPCTQLSVLSGTVTIRSPSMAPRQLNAGEAIVNIDEGQSYHACLDKAAGAPALRWSYVDVPLSTVINDVSRFYPKKIIIKSPDLANEHVTTTFKIDEVGNVIDSIPNIADAHIEKGEDGTLYISR